MKNSISIALPAQRVQNVTVKFFPFYRKTELSTFKEIHKVYGKLIVIKAPLNLFHIKIYMDKV